MVHWIAPGDLPCSVSESQKTRTSVVGGKKWIARGSPRKGSKNNGKLAAPAGEKQKGAAAYLRTQGNSI